MKTSNQVFQGVVRSPFLWGLSGAVGFYALIHAGVFDLPVLNRWGGEYINEFVTRYFTKHPVEYMETVLFSVGLAALVIKLLDTLAQRTRLSQSLLGPALQANQPPENCDSLLTRLDRLPGRQQGDYLVSRLRAAIKHVRFCGSAESLSNELKYLADIDLSRLQASYGLFRVIVWAIPILGFLGTVIGITMALNAVDFQNPESSMMQVLKGLGLKFDTTALALALSMVLMFVHFCVERIENTLLEQVDERTPEELAGRFPALPEGPDGQLIAVRRMAETMLQAADVLVQRQAELWQTSMNTAASRWTQMANTAGERLQTSLSSALSESLKTYAQHMAAVEQANADRSRQTWDETRQLQMQNVQLMGGLQTELGRQAEVLRRAVEAAGEVTRLEDALNHNLTALAGAKHFEQTVLSLAAAVNLLGARLTEMPGDAAPVRLEPQRRAAHAA